MKDAFQSILQARFTPVVMTCLLVFLSVCFLLDGQKYSGYIALVAGLIAGGITAFFVYTTVYLRMAWGVLGGNIVYSLPQILEITASKIVLGYEGHFLNWPMAFVFSILIILHFLHEKDILPAFARSRQTNTLTLDLPQKPQGMAPFDLLSWQARLTKVIGRDDEIKRLTAWLKGVEVAPKKQQNTLGIAVVSGDGGVGKTRLAAELVERHKKAWHAGFVDKSETNAEFSLTAKKHLIVLDYPEERLDFIKAFLQRLATLKHQHPVAVMFLSRKDRDYWQRFFEDSQVGSDVADALDLQPIQAEEASADATAAWQIYEAACTEIASRKSNTTDFGTFDLPTFQQWLALDGLHRYPLFILAKAIEQAETETEASTQTGLAILQALANREKRRLKKQATDDVTGVAMCCIKAVAIINDGLDLSLAGHQSELHELTEGLLPKLSSKQLSVLCDKELVAKSAPQASRQVSAIVDKVQPDLLAACFLVEVLLDLDNIDDQAATTWAFAALALNPAVNIHNLSRLVYDIGRLYPADTANEIMGLVFNTSMSSGIRTLRASRLQLAVYEGGVPNLATLLSDIARSIDTREMKPAELAIFLLMKSNRFYDAGLDGDALEAMKESVNLYRELVESDASSYNANLALGLNNLSVHLLSQGLGSEALLAVEESVELYRVLVRSNPSHYNADLAGSLNNLSNSLSSQGQEAEALVAVQESVELYRVLVRSSPSRHNADLAMGLSTLSNRLWSVGRKAEALVAVEESVELYRVLVENNPSRYTADLAMSLNILSNSLSSQGREAEALVAVEESVELYRVLVENNPSRYTAGLASSLNNLSNRLPSQGKRAEALLVAQESIELYRVLVENHPSRYNADLALILNNLSNRLSSQGRESEALLAVEESVELYRVLAKSNPSRYNADLAKSLNNLSNHLSAPSVAKGRGSEALLAVEESVKLYRVLVESNPSRYNANLAMSLNTLSLCLSAPSMAKGREAEALAAIEKCIDIRRVLTEQNPQRHAPDLAASLANCSLRVVDSDPQRAVALIEEALGLIRPAAEQYPDSQHGQWYQQMLEWQEQCQAKLNESNNTL